MKAKRTKVTRKFTAAMSALMIAGQFASTGAIYAHAENASGVDYSVEQNVTSSWYGGCCAEIVLTNLSDSETENWKISFSSTDKISNLWNGTITACVETGDSYQYTVEALDYNDVIAAGQSIAVGYIGEGNDHGFTDVKAELIYAGNTTIVPAKEQEQETKIEVEVNEKVNTGSITNFDGLVITDDNQFYSILLNEIDNLKNVCEIPYEGNARTWVPAWVLNHSNGGTDVAIEATPDVKLSGDGMDMEDYLFRISGTIRGEEIESYVDYSQVVSLRACFERTRRVQIEMVNDAQNGFDAYFVMRHSSNIAVLSSDDLGQIVLHTDSNVDLRNGDMVHVYDISFDVADEKLFNTDISGKMEVIR